MINVLERFETSRSGKLAAEVVATREGLRWHPSSEAQKILQNLDTHYRNANIRLAISGELINDLLPVLQPIQEQVRDNILGAEVLGQNKTWTNLRVGEWRRRRSTARFRPLRWFMKRFSKCDRPKCLLTVGRTNLFLSRRQPIRCGKY